MMLGWMSTDLERLYNTMDSGENLSFVQMVEEYNSLVIDLTKHGNRHCGIKYCCSYFPLTILLRNFVIIKLALATTATNY